MSEKVESFIDSESVINSIQPSKSPLNESKSEISNDVILSSDRAQSQISPYRARQDSAFKKKHVQENQNIENQIKTNEYDLMKLVYF